MRIVSWNINSLRMRMELVRRFVQQEQPDVLCLQEIKVDDPLFPMEDVKGLGFDHVLHHGMKGYNGVAILSKLPMQTRAPNNWCLKNDSRREKPDSSFCEPRESWRIRRLQLCVWTRSDMQTTGLSRLDIGCINHIYQNTSSDRRRNTCG